MKTRSIVLIFAVLLVFLLIAGYRSLIPKTDIPTTDEPPEIPSDDELSAMQPAGMRIAIEELTPPEKSLQQTASEQIVRKIIFDQSEGKIKEPYDILCTSEMPENMVASSHPFFCSVYQAYADHRPFVLSPDMVWMLIEQGFARHVAHNHEALRSKFVEFDGKMSLILTNVPLDAPREIWEQQIGRSVAKADDKTHGDLSELLTADFTTTTPAERVASQITMMHAVRNYFEFIWMQVICGIPEVILLGTPEDWQKILDRTHRLGTYDLEWWTDELEPVLKKIVAASKGEQDTEFWLRMFRCHAPGGCVPGSADGWIARFYPYDKTGNRRSLKTIGLFDSPALPAEAVSVEVKHVSIQPDGKTEIRMLELVAGFVGAEQYLGTYALKPRIGWFLRMKGKDEEKIVLPDNRDDLSIRVDKIPQEFAQLECVRRLEIEFIGPIDIPEWMGSMRIGELHLNGKTDDEAIRHIRKLLPETNLYINGQPIAKEPAEK